MNELARKIAAETARHGPLTFARFMDLALYCPVYGYYEKEGDKIGRRGDYYTSVSVGKLFGQLLACQFAEWLDAASAPAQCQLSGAGCHAEGQIPAPPGHLRLVEAGAHRGDLASDVLAWFSEHRPELFGRLCYWIVEPSGRRQQWQQETLARFSGRVRWTERIESLSEELEKAPGNAGGVTIIFCNELLDAMPIHRLGWDAAKRAWFEWGVAVDGGQFVWVRLQPDEAEVRDWLEQSGLPAAGLAEVLPDGYTIEVSPAACDWWRSAGRVVKRGKLVAIDYGATGAELMLPERHNGTLRAYCRHQVSADPLSEPGEQDLTAHVNFTALERAGASAGLHTEAFITQAQFLTAIAARIWENRVAFGSWTPADTRQFQTLTHPDHLGRAFRVLVQAPR